MSFIPRGLGRSLGDWHHITGDETMFTSPATKNYPVAQHHAGRAIPLLNTARPWHKDYSVARYGNEHQAAGQKLPT